MVDSLMAFAERFRRPAYTGADRCWPCTALNLAIVAAVTLVCVRRDRGLVGVLALAGGVAAIVLRGYVVPFTPVFAPKLVAASPLPDGLFGKTTGQREGRDSLTAVETDGETVLRDLMAAGVVEAPGDVVRPTASIDSAWRREMARLADLSLAEVAAVAAEELPHVSTVRPYDDGQSAWLVVDGDLVAYPVAVAELAAHRALGDAVTDAERRLAGARAFRMFLDSCPVCDTALVASSTVSCCGGYTDPHGTPDETLVCPSCEQRLYTF